MIIFKCQTSTNANLPIQNILSTMLSHNAPNYFTAPPLLNH